VAKDHFGFVESDRLKSVIADAYTYVEENANGKKFDLILMDINYEEENMEMSPPFKFVQTQFLHKLTV